jgi:RNA polymerase sigma-70 factor (ECF subfamily)
VENLPGWVVAAAMNRVRSGARRRGAEQRAVERLRQVPSPVSAAPTAVADEVLDALRSLPERQREITALHYLLDLSVVDIATSLEVSEGTVKTQLHRARAALRARLEPETTGDANDEEVDHVT